MMWKDVEREAPKVGEEVLVTDGHGSFTVATCQGCSAWHGNLLWEASDDLLLASNHDGRATITMDHGYRITEWCEIDHHGK